MVVEKDKTSAAKNVFAGLGEVPSSRGVACRDQRVSTNDIELSRRRSEMEQARERFRRTGYDHPQSTFNNNGDIADVLKGMLEGVVRSGALWDLLQQGHRSRPTRGSTDFGLPDFPLPFPLPGGDTNDATGGAWRNPSSRGGWSPGQPDGSANNNDFSTGGSF